MKNEICFFMPDFSGGGAEVVIVKLANHLVRSGVKTSIIVLDKKGPNLNQLSAEVELHTLNTESGKYKWLFIIPSIYKLVRLIKIKPNAVFFSSVFFNNLILSVSSFLSPCRFNVIEHTLKQHQLNKVNTLIKNTMMRISRFIYKRAKNVVCVSHSVESDLIKLFGLKNTCVIYNPLFTKEILLKRSELPLQKTNSSVDSSKKIIYVGRLIKSKQVDILLFAIAKIKPSNRRFRLYIYGEGPELSNLSEIIKKYELDDVVSFMGFEGNIEKIYENCELLVLPSKYEGFGNVIAEAHSFCIPTIACRGSGGPEEIIIDSSLGAIVNANATVISEEIIQQLMKPIKSELFLKSSLRFTLDEACKHYLNLV